MNMRIERYEKPVVTSEVSARGIIPLAALSAAQAAALATVAGFGAGIAMGSNKGRSDVFPLGRLSILQEGRSES